MRQVYVSLCVCIAHCLTVSVCILHSLKILSSSLCSTDEQQSTGGRSSLHDRRVSPPLPRRYIHHIHERGGG